MQATKLEQAGEGQAGKEENLEQLGEGVEVLSAEALELQEWCCKLACSSASWGSLEVGGAAAEELAAARAVLLANVVLRLADLMPKLNGELYGLAMEGIDEAVKQLKQLEALA